MTKKEPTSNQDNQTDEKRLSADTKKDTSKKSAETTSQEDAPYQKSEEISHVEELLDKITENATLQDLIEQIDKHLEAEEALLTILKREQELLENFNNAIADRDKYLSMLQRFKADFENYKKRAKKQNENKVQFHSQRIVSKIFEPIEELNKAITYAKETEQETIPLEGLNIIYNKLVRNLKDEGFAFIEPSKGDVF
ncbi:MAG: nucleotide exchange factor GrpE, partial [Asgard group archaeon]|nr:nucleotide exchange factor GrpE [Asgard group archaeon]